MQGEQKTEIAVINKTMIFLKKFKIPAVCSQVGLSNLPVLKKHEKVV